MEFVRRSATGLVVKIIVIEVTLELIYLLLSAGLVNAQDSLNQSYTVARIILSAIFLTLAIGAVVILVSQWANEGYYLKSNELIVRKGVLAKTEVAYPYANMQSVTVQQSVAGRLFNYGQISIFIPTLSKDIIFTEISNPQAFADKLKQHIPYPETGQFIIKK